MTYETEVIFIGNFVWLYHKLTAYVVWIVRRFASEDPVNIVWKVSFGNFAALCTHLEPRSSVLIFVELRESILGPIYYVASSSPQMRIVLSAEACGLKFFHCFFTHVLRIFRV
jgi:hypothetical protein